MALLVQVSLWSMNDMITWKGCNFLRFQIHIPSGTFFPKRKRPLNGTCSVVYDLSTQVYKQPAHKEYTLAVMMKSQKACYHLSKRALLKVVSGDTVTAGEMLPAVYGLDPAMSLSALWHSGDRCSLAASHTCTDLLPSLQYSTMYPSRPQSPMVSGVRHLMVRLESFTSSTDTSRGALVGTETEQIH